MIALAGPITEEERFSAVSVIPVFPMFLVIILFIVIPGLNGLILLGRKFFVCRFIEFWIDGFWLIFSYWSFKSARRGKSSMTLALSRQKDLIINICCNKSWSYIWSFLNRTLPPIEDKLMFLNFSRSILRHADRWVAFATSMRLTKVGSNKTSSPIVNPFVILSPKGSFLVKREKDPNRTM